MAGKVTNFSDLIQRVAASCLLHPLAAGRHGSGENRVGDDDDEYELSEEHEDEEEEEERESEAEEKERLKAWEGMNEEVRVERVVEMERLMNEVFDTVSGMKRAYASLQEAHCPWDPEKMRVADVAVVGELRKLGVLRERFRRTTSLIGGSTRRKSRGRGRGSGVATVREVVAPYEAAVEELKREVKLREVEVENLKEKLRTVAVSSLSLTGTNGKKGSSRSHHSKRKVVSAPQGQVMAGPAPEVFETTMKLVKDASKSFTMLLLSLMRSAHWDIAAAVRSIEAAANATDDLTSTTATIAACSVVATQHAKYALESYICRKVFQGFDHETFYMDGSLSSLLNPDQYRRDCFTQYRDMKAMDPSELLGIMPTCHFGKFCSKKYLAVVHPKMEESLFGDLEQRRQVLAENHPRSQFYGEFLMLTKAVWLLHLLAFSLDPAPSQFEASRGAEFHPQYMESVVKFPGGRVPAGQIVGFSVSPGFKLGNGSVIRARVYLVART
ncbi:protein GRAVITROPIC IN THE LIGHT 1 isoform X1 [Juglans microcarpa x Juglans regia]|uniref:protein GRAVITROPIC IN THE LIGHT 1 isoform X1 n=1 Tax=Juglans microcarpa x Juglans regia TaxID=2249226 RepID=UPI001B7ED607|nr:protein GRAVITROPIC IN THE LIGHT 1 isoform X1 [Juglans microcarpa x Juglans regia]